MVLTTSREINFRGRRRGPIVARGWAFDIGSSRALLGRADWRYRVNRLPELSATTIGNGAGLTVWTDRKAPFGDLIGFVPPKYSKATLMDGSAHG